jgi:hypothetical protein
VLYQQPVSGVYAQIQCCYHAEDMQHFCAEWMSWGAVQSSMCCTSSR